MGAGHSAPGDRCGCGFPGSPRRRGPRADEDDAGGAVARGAAPASSSSGGVAGAGATTPLPPVAATAAAGGAAATAAAAGGAAAATTPRSRSADDVAAALQQQQQQQHEELRVSSISGPTEAAGATAAQKSAAAPPTEAAAAAASPPYAAPPAAAGQTDSARSSFAAEASAQQQQKQPQQQQPANGDNAADDDEDGGDRFPSAGAAKALSSSAAAAARPPPSGGRPSTGHLRPPRQGTAPPPQRYSLNALRLAGRAFSEALPPQLRGAYALAAALPAGCAAPLAVLAAAWGWRPGGGDGDGDGGAAAAQRTLAMARELADRGVLQIAAAGGGGGGADGGGGGAQPPAQPPPPASPPVPGGGGGPLAASDSELWCSWVAAAADHLAFLHAAHEGTRALQDAHARVLDLYLWCFDPPSAAPGGELEAEVEDAEAAAAPFGACVEAAAAHQQQHEGQEEGAEHERGADTPASVARRAARLRRAALAAAPREGGYLLRGGMAHHLSGCGRAGRRGELRAALLRPDWLERRLHSVGVAPLVEDLRRCLSLSPPAAGARDDDDDALLRLLLRALQAGLPACDDRPGVPMLRRQLLLRMMAAARGGGRAVREWYARERAAAERDGAEAFARAFAEAERESDAKDEEEAAAAAAAVEDEPLVALPPCHLLCRAPTLQQAGSAHRSSLRTHGPPLRCAAIQARDAMVAGDDGAVTVYDADLGDAVLRLTLGPMPGAGGGGGGDGAAAAAAGGGAPGSVSGARASGASSSEAATGGAPATMPRWDEGARVTAMASASAAAAAVAVPAVDAAGAAAEEEAAPPHSLCLAGDAAGRFIVWDLTAGGALVAGVVAHRRVSPVIAAGAGGQARASSASSPRPSSAAGGASGSASPSSLPAAPIAVVAATADGSLALTASPADPRARLWRLPALTLALELPHAEAERRQKQSTEGTAAAAASAAASARLSGASSGGVLSAALSPDGALAVTTGSVDRAAVLWDVAAGVSSGSGAAAPVVLRGHEGWVVSCAFAPAPLLAGGGTSPSSPWLVLTASHDGTARVWSAATGACLHVLRGHDGRLGSVMAAAAPPPLPQPRPSHEGGGGGGGGARSVARAPAAARAITAGDDATARVWCLRTGACLAVLGPDAHRGWVSVCALDTSGTVAVTADGGGSVAVWEVPADEGVGVRESDAAAATTTAPPEAPATPNPLALFAGAHAREVTDLRLTRRGGFAVTCSADGSARLFDLRAARAAAALAAAAAAAGGGAGATPRCSGASASSEAQAAAAAMVAASVGAHDGGVRGVVAAAAAATSSGGRGAEKLLPSPAVVSAGEDGALRAWDACGTGECLAQAPRAHACAVQWLFAARPRSPPVGGAAAAAACPQHLPPPLARVVSASGDRRFAGWDFYGQAAADQAAHAQPQALEPRAPPRALLPSALGSRTKSVAVSGDGGVALVVLFDSSVTAFRLGLPVAPPSPASRRASSLPPRPSDASATSGGGGGGAADDDPLLLARLIRRGDRGAHSGGVNSVAVSRCGRVAVTSSKDTTARVWELPPAAPGAQAAEGHSDSEGAGAGAAAGAAGSRGPSLEGAAAPSSAASMAVAARCTAVLQGHSDAVTCALLLEQEDEAEGRGADAGGKGDGASESAPASAAAPPPLLVATGSLDGDVRVWDRRTGACLATLSPPVPAAAGNGADADPSSSPSPAGVRALGWDGGRAGGLLFSLDDAEAPRSRARLWRVAPARPQEPRLVASLSHSGGVPVLAAAFGGSSNALLATGGADCTVIVWHARSGAPLAFFAADASITALAFASLGGGGGGGGGCRRLTVVAGDAGGHVHCVAVPPLHRRGDDCEEEEGDDDAPADAFPARFLASS